jgi:hypothetical protein
MDDSKATHVRIITQYLRANLSKFRNEQDGEIWYNDDDMACAVLNHFDVTSDYYYNIAMDVANKIIHSTK